MPQLLALALEFGLQPDHAPRRAQARAQHDRPERTGDEIVRPGVEHRCEQGVVLGGNQHQHVDGTPQARLAQRPHHVDAGDVPEPPVDQHHVRLQVDRCLDALASAVGFEHRKAVAFEDPTQALPLCRI